MGNFFAEEAAALRVLAAAATAAARAFDYTPALPREAKRAAEKRADLAMAAVAVAAGPHSGTELHVSLNNGAWRDACLLGRGPDFTADPRWLVFFYDTAEASLVRFADVDNVQVWFTRYAHRGRVEVWMLPDYGRQPAWFGGLSVQCAAGDTTLGVMFDDGDWMEGLPPTASFFRPEAAKPPRGAAAVAAKHEQAAAVAAGGAAVAVKHEQAAAVAVKHEQAGAGSVAAEDAAKSDAEERRAKQRANERAKDAAKFDAEDRRAKERAKQRAEDAAKFAEDRAMFAKDADDRAKNCAKDAKDAEDRRAEDRAQTAKDAKAGAARKLGEAGGAVSSDVFRARPLRAAMVKNIGMSYQDKRVKRENGGGDGAAAGARPLAPGAQKWEIERVCGVKMLYRAWYYKIRWAGYGPGDDSWERGRQLSRDTGAEYLRRLVDEYNNSTA
jgi:hypothetical protein